MENILNYVNLRSDIPFSSKGVNPIDILVFAELSYVDLKQIWPGGRVSLLDLGNLYFSKYSEEEIHQQYLYSLNIPNLLRACMESERFKDVELMLYEDQFSDEKIVQFGAVTFVLPDGTLVVGYRGTDGSITGWKENLEMTYSNDLICWELASDYLKHVLDSVQEKSYFFGLRKKKVYPSIYVTGHSKGGHLAMYSYLDNLSLQKFITSVYSFDGPGFLGNIWDQYDGSDLSKITNYIPQASIIGRLMDHKEVHKIVSCGLSGLAGHDAFCWGVKTCDFDFVDVLDQDSDEMVAFVDRLLLSKSIEEKAKYVQMIGLLLDRMEIKSINDLNELSIRQAISGFKELRQFNAEDIKFLLEVARFVAQQSAFVLKGKR